ncbi:hypothetical protein DXG03_009431 [Asterophora parasitica]|uniref:F-box domain-containing protein n=1 Tax=Asterophora parasitica TaxID=117018 RepID=A0A9P7GDA6_9AGAR|nr:hypothetical protein DXG03_009431 [Asterophora parasitica]
MTLDHDPFHPLLEHDSFPELRTLTISADSAESIEFLQNDFFPQKVIDLRIELPQWEEPSNIESLLLTMSSRTNLQKVSLGDIRDRDTDDMPAEDAMIICPMTLRPIYSLPKLTSLTLNFKYPLRWTTDHLTQFVQEIPSLEYLFLNNSPTVRFQRHTRHRLNDICIFARYCPRLKTLGFFFDVDSAVLSPYGIRQFAALEECHPGNSVLKYSDVDRIALFLSQVFPSGCRLIARPSHPFWPAVIRGISSMRSMEVIAASKMATRLRELEDEIAELRKAASLPQ